MTVTLASSNTTVATVSPASLTFNASNWNVSRAVNITTVDNLVADGTRAARVVATVAASSDAAFRGLPPTNISVTVLDNDAVRGPPALLLIRV